MILKVFATHTDKAQQTLPGGLYAKLKREEGTKKQQLCDPFE